MQIGRDSNLKEKLNAILTSDVPRSNHKHWVISKGNMSLISNVQVEAKEDEEHKISMCAQGSPCRHRSKQLSLPERYSQVA